LPLDEAIKKFGDYEKKLLKDFCSETEKTNTFIKGSVVNPLNLHKCYGCEHCKESENYFPNIHHTCSGTGIITRTYEEYMKIGIAHLLTCNEIHMLPDWKDSKGAKIEHDLADALEMKIVYVK